MVNCQAFECTNDKRKGFGRTFYSIPIPERYPEKSDCSISYESVGLRRLLNLLLDGKSVGDDQFASTFFQEDFETYRSSINY